MFVEFGILLIGALSHRADMKVKGMENSVGGETLKEFALLQALSALLPLTCNFLRII